MSRRTALLIGAIGLLAGLTSEHVRQVWLQPLFVPLTDLAVGWLLVGCGLVAAVARPNQTAGRRLVLAGFLWIVGAPRQWFADTGRTNDFLQLDDLSFTLVGWSDAVIAITALSFPNARPFLRQERVMVGALVAAYAAQTVIRFMLRSPDLVGFQLGDQDLVRPSVALADLGRIAVLVVVGALLVQRWRSSSQPARRLLGPVVLAGAAMSFAPLYASWFPLSQLGLVSPLPEDLAVPAFWLTNGLRALVPIAMLVGILRQRRSRSAVADAIASVGQAPSSSELAGALARAFGDPSLRVLAWDEQAHAYADGAGVAVSLPVGAGPQMVTEVTSGDRPLAVIVHDRALAEDPSLIAAAVAVTRLVAENQRLNAELVRQLEEVRASRARIVEAGDAERLRIERDLHDGVQQRLLALALSLRRAESESATEPGRALDALRHGAVEAVGAVEDVRELAQGIHPAVLSEAGLAAAIRALADRSPVPVDLSLAIDGNIPPRAAAAAYFVASEALANVVKHAGATAVRISATEANGVIRVAVEDDGQGGADRQGRGLRGLDDRLAAIGGELEVADRPAGGTVVSATIPIE